MKNCNFAINRDHIVINKGSHASTLTDIPVDILIPIIQLIANGLNYI